MISDLEVIVRLALAVLLGGLVGLEREVKGRAAGFRTHILVCIGSALVMLTSVFLTGKTGNLDTHMAAQVVSGIGFLGAGTIIQFRDSIRGLTTAASVWASAGLGLAVGAGFYVGAVSATLIVLIVLFALGGVERRLGAKGKAYPWADGPEAKSVRR